MKIHTTLTITAAALALALGAQVLMSVHSHTPVSNQMTAYWQENPKNMKELEALADEVVIGKVIAITHAEDLVPLDADNLEGVDVSIAAEMITIEVSSQLKGKKRSKAQTIKLFHTGHSNLHLERKKPPPASERPPKPDKDDEAYPEGPIKKADAPKSKPAAEAEGAIPFTLHDDPAYKKGEKYVLFVRKGPKLKVKGKSTDTLAIVHPSGRYRVSKDNKLEPAAEHGFATKLKGQTVDDMKAKVAAVRKGAPKK